MFIPNNYCYASMLLRYVHSQQLLLCIYVLTYSTYCSNSTRTGRLFNRACARMRSTDIIKASISRTCVNSRAPVTTALRHLLAPIINGSEKVGGSLPFCKASDLRYICVCTPAKCAAEPRLTCVMKCLCVIYAFITRRLCVHAPFISS